MHSLLLLLLLLALQQLLQGSLRRLQLPLQCGDLRALPPYDQLLCRQLLLLLRQHHLVLLGCCLHLRVHLPLQRRYPRIVLCCDLPLLLRGPLLCCKLLVQGFNPRSLLSCDVLC
jgi:hypothetical protein